MIHVAHNAIDIQEDSLKEQALAYPKVLGKQGKLLAESSGCSLICFLNDCAVTCNDAEMANAQSKISCFFHIVVI